MLAMPNKDRATGGSAQRILASEPGIGLERFRRSSA
jgi:hypothetical protein